MESVTKSKINLNTIELMVNKAFGSKISAVSINELIDGYYNNSYKIVLSNNQTVVLKVSPKSNVNVLTYEKYLMESEVKTNKILNELKIPSPKILFYDNSSKLIDCDYFFMSFIKGNPFNKIKTKLNENQVKYVYASLGRIIKPLSLFSGDTFFGELSSKGKKYNNWYDCFYNMVLDLFQDANKINLILPISKEETVNILKRNKDLLLKVRKPCLVHKDLWDGNIFVDVDSYNILGIIDSERTIFAEPLMEIACGHLDKNIDFIENYLGKKILNEEEITRLNLYKFYLYLLMIIECPYRKYENDDQYNWSTLKLNEIKQLF